MEVEGRVAVVTGAGRGIGAAIAAALAAAGASVVVADLDGETAAATAEEIDASRPGAVRAIGADVADPAAIEAILALAADSFGPVDLYFANAGVVEGGGLADEARWERAIEVNLKAHVRAARLLVPEWRRRGSGYFVSSASAAGLLTQVGRAPYAVSKHAAVGFAEWLAVTYGAEGIRVSCLCPMGVATRMHASGLAAEGEERLGALTVDVAGEVLAPEEVAASVLAGVEAEPFLILPHPEVLEFYRRKGIDYDGWIGSIQRLQGRVRAES